MHRVLPDLASARELIAARGGELGRPLHLLAETTSTNDEAKHAARAGAPHGSTWVTDSQTAGRGRLGRVWTSPRGENLLFSVLLRTSARPERLPLVSLVAGLAVAEAVEGATGSPDVRIKWPNDVVVLRGAGGYQKLAGVLVETSITGRAVDGIVIGIGVNVHTRAFPPEIAELATSIALVSHASATRSPTQTAPDRATILADILEGLDRDVALVLAKGLGPVHARLTARDALRGQLVRSDRGEGTALGIALDGSLVVEASGERVAWNAGEVVLARRD